MEESINAIINVKCFNCKDKGTVVIVNDRGRAALIPCPICNPKPTEEKDKHPEEHF